jgi:hypothetical protein
MPDEKEEYKPEENWGEVEEKTEETEEPEEGDSEEEDKGTEFTRTEQDVGTVAKEENESSLPAKSTR